MEELLRSREKFYPCKEIVYGIIPPIRKIIRAAIKH